MRGRPDITDRVDRVRPRSTLLDRVRAFDEATRRGDHYDAFPVNSRTRTLQSEGTRAWIAECRRLLARTCRSAGPVAETREAFDRLFALLGRLDDGEEDVFFADEGGSWQVDVDWSTVLPVYFRVLAATTSPDQYARIGHGLVRRFGRGRAELFRRALRTDSAGFGASCPGRSRDQRGRFGWWLLPGSLRAGTALT